jgi:RNA polymerase sigma factor (sigma-70 family)
LSGGITGYNLGMDTQDTTQIRIAIDALHSDFEGGRNMLLAVALSRLRQLIQHLRCDFPWLYGQSDNTESLVLEKLNRALEAGHRPQTALHFWNLSAKITRQVLIDLVRVQKNAIATTSIDSVNERFTSAPSDSNDPAKLIEFSELHQLIERVGARLSSQDSELLTLRFYTDLSFNEIAEVLGMTIDAVRYHWRLIRIELAAEWNKDPKGVSIPSV